MGAGLCHLQAVPHRMNQIAGLDSLQSIPLVSETVEADHCVQCCRSIGINLYAVTVGQQ
jgi:hypothetical protein